jgi:RNA polymerase sigma-70 factor, ECF subfamily
MEPSAGEVTRLLRAWCKGDAQALEQLAPVIEHELRVIARAYLNREASDHTLQPTALINEAYVRLIEWNNNDWKDRAHFLAVAAKMMRRILVNHAVTRQRQKRGGGAILVSLMEADNVPEKSEDLIALDEALTALAKFDERKSRLVELRYFGGLTMDEAAEVLGVSLRTVHREWDFARTWLFRELRGSRKGLLARKASSLCAGDQAAIRDASQGLDACS